MTQAQAAPKESKEQILAAFSKLLSEEKQAEAKVATKEEEAEKEKNKELLKVASNYTVDNIVNTMATLQLDFGTIINQLTEKLATESSKLDELKRARAVENEQLKQLRKIRLVADALYILRQEHQAKLKELASQTAARQEVVEKEMLQGRKIWEKQQQEFEIKIQEEAELTTKQREQEAADYQYEIERSNQVEMDEYEEHKRLQERELQELNRDKEKAWVERQKYLADRQAEFEENQQKIAGFEEELKQAYLKAKEDAIKDADREAKVKTELIEKEWEAANQGYQLKIQSLQATIERQTEQIADITGQLQAATNQAQQLAMRAFQSSNSKAS